MSLYADSRSGYYLPFRTKLQPDFNHCEIDTDIAFRVGHRESQQHEEREYHECQQRSY